MIRLPQNPNRYQGPPTRYAGSFSAGWYTSNGFRVGPPWTQLVAYDLNEGTIKWRVADGQAPGLADKAIQNTGTVRPRNGPVVTAGGLVFLANSQDRILRAFDKDTGHVVWEHELEANPEGIPAVYQVNGRQYIAFAAGASWGTGPIRCGRTRSTASRRRIEAQGYHVFALPANGRPTVTRSLAKRTPMRTLFAVGLTGALVGSLGPSGAERSRRPPFQRAPTRSSA